MISLVGWPKLVKFFFFTQVRASSDSVTKVTVLEVETLGQPQQRALWVGVSKRLQQMDTKQALPAILSIAVIVICFSSLLQMPIAAETGEARHYEPEL